MTASYRSDHAADPDLYERLMRERYGPLPELMAERDHPRLPAPARRPMLPAAQATPDPDAATHYAELQEAIVEAAIGRPRPIVATKERIPPVPGAIWCDSCTSWCTPQGMCRCNDR